jgi:hypothetical protein
VKPGILNVAIRATEANRNVYRSLFFPQLKLENFNANNGISDTSKNEKKSTKTAMIMGWFNECKKFSGLKTKE